MQRNQGGIPKRFCSESTWKSRPVRHQPQVLPVGNVEVSGCDVAQLTVHQANLPPSERGTRQIHLLPETASR